jgi:hypothetical protein
LPEGKADTLALLLDEAASAAFIEGQADFAAAKAEVVADLPPAPPVALVVDVPRRLLLTTANPMSSGGATLMLNPDGSAAAHDQVGSGPARWVWENGVLTVTLDQPFVVTSFQFWTDPATGIGQQLRTEYRTLGFRVRLINGTWTRGVAEFDARMAAAYMEGPPAGQPPEGFIDTDQGYPLTLLDVGAGLGLTAEELGDGVRIAGLPVGDATQAGSGAPTRDDVVRLAADGTARLELSEKDATWTLDDGWVVLTYDGLTRRYTRVSRDPLTGVEVWQAEGRFDGVDGRVLDATAAVVDPALAFTAENAARRWRGEGFYRISPEIYAGNLLDLYADGTTAGTPVVTRWSVGPTGVLEMVRERNGQDYPRRWIPMVRTGEHWLVLEVVDFTWAGSGVQWRVNWYRDLGPAVR